MKSKKQNFILDSDSLFDIQHAIDYKLAANEKLHWDIVSVLGSKSNSNGNDVINNLRSYTYKLEKCKEKLNKLYASQFNDFAHSKAKIK